MPDSVRGLALRFVRTCPAALHRCRIEAIGIGVTTGTSESVGSRAEGLVFARSGSSGSREGLIVRVVQ